MYFHIVNSKNEPVISGKMALMRPHTTASEKAGKQAFLVYMQDVELDKEKFQDWSSRYLLYNRAVGSGGKPAGSEYDYIEFILDEFRGGYSFMVSETRHKFAK